MKDQPRRIKVLTAKLTLGVLMSTSAMAQEAAREVVVEFAKDVDFQQMNDLVEKLQAKEMHPLAGDLHILKSDRADLEKLLEGLGERGGIHAIEVVDGPFDSLFKVTPIEKTANLPAEALAALNSLREENWAGDLVVGEFSNNMLKRSFLREGDANDSIRILLPGGEQKAFFPKRVKPVAGAGRAFTWLGKGGGADEALLVVDGESVTGEVTIGEKAYQIRPLGENLHAVTEVLSVPMPEHPPEQELLEQAADEEELLDQEAGPRADVPEFHLKLLVAYTSEVARHRREGDIQAWIQLAIEQTNLALANTRIPGRVSKTHVVKVDYNEDGSFIGHRDRFAAGDDGLMDEIHPMRDEFKADICALLVADDRYCGIAKKIKATSESAFFVTNYDCAAQPQKYSFAHELGHLLGARHNPEEDPSIGPFHGYWFAGRDRFRTVMSYNGECSCDRIKHFSNPGVSYRGNFGRYSTGTEAMHNNAKIMTRHGFVAQRFR